MLQFTCLLGANSYCHTQSKWCNCQCTWFSECRTWPHVLYPPTSAFFMNVRQPYCLSLSGCSLLPSLSSFQLKSVGTNSLPLLWPLQEEGSWAQLAWKVKVSPPCIGFPGIGRGQTRAVSESQPWASKASIYLELWGHPVSTHLWGEATIPLIDLLCQTSDLAAIIIITTATVSQSSLSVMKTRRNSL